MQQRKIGIMGGSFDPVHYGHLVLAEEVRCRFALDKILFIPNGIAPHKQGRVTDSESRYEMTVLATKDNEFFEVSRFEIDRPRISYTVETLEWLRSTYGDDVELFFITGADTLLDLESWWQFERVLSLSHFVGATRPGYPTDHLEIKAEQLRSRYQATIELITIPGLAISSTEIRDRVSQGRNIRYLVPKPVQSFIEERRLYGKNHCESE